ncbi:MAG: hypothetical protein J6K24_03405 [Tidjanibacter sp.]|nr:hypothetical protein [Tidjanibacter sp.]
MGEVDYLKKRNCARSEDEELLLRCVVCDDAELLFLDSWLRDSFTQQ